MALYYAVIAVTVTAVTKVHENRGISKRMKIKIKATESLTGLPYRARSTNLTFVSWLFSTNEIN